jgi:hypothetical protein
MRPAVDDVVLTDKVAGYLVATGILPPGAVTAAHAGFKSRFKALAGRALSFLDASRTERRPHRNS